MFKRSKQLLKANTLLKEELENLKKEYEKKAREAANLGKLLYEMNMGYMLLLPASRENTIPEDFIIQYANDGVMENVRLKHHVIIGESIKEVFPSFYESLFQIGKEALNSGNRTSCIEYDAVEDRYLKFSCYEESDHECACIIMDITDSFLSEKLIEDREERYRSMFLVSEEMIFELNMEGRFTYISEGIRDMLGYEPEDYLGRYYYEQYPEDIRKSRAYLFQNKFTECGQEIKGLMTEILAKDGTCHHVIQNGVVLMDDEGNDTGYRGIYIDVTKCEEARRKAESIASSCSDMTVKIGRELRTPLHAIIGLSSLALEEPRIYKIYRYLKRLEASAMEALNTLSTALDYSNMEGEEIRLYEEAFSLQLVLKKVTSLLLVKAQEKNVRLLVEVEEHVPDTYSGDSMRLSQILMNLLSHAIKHTSEGYVKLMIRMRDKGLLFIIKDTSCGMIQEDFSSLYEPLESGQRNADLTQAGLGLLISKQLIKAMGGRIKVLARPKEGTRVYVALPFMECREDLVRSTEYDGERTGRPWHYPCRVLVVEENVANQIVACELLEKFGASVTVAKDGTAAMSLATKDAYDLILLDLSLSGQSGNQICMRMRKLHVTAPIIAMTAEPLENIGAEYPSVKFDDYIVKPLTQYKVEYILRRYAMKERTDVLAACMLEEYDGEAVYPFSHIDSQSAIMRLDGRVELFDRIVMSFLKEYQQDAAKFIKLEADDRSKARRYIHALKGASEALGAFELSALARQLEEMLAKGICDKGLVGVYTAELKAVIQELIPYKESIKKPIYIRGYQRDKAEALVKILDKQLKSHSAVALEQVPEIYEVLYREDLKEEAERMIGQIENYDFEPAEKTLQTIKESLGVKE